MIIKKLRNQVGVLDPETTELFVLDELASKIFWKFANSSEVADIPTCFIDHRDKESDEKEIISYLQERGVLVDH